MYVFVRVIGSGDGLCNSFSAVVSLHLSVPNRGCFYLFMFNLVAYSIFFLGRRLDLSALMLTGSPDYTNEPYHEIMALFVLRKLIL